VRRRLIRLRRRLSAGQAAIERAINGQDAEGAVEVVLGAGGLVEQVRLDPDWPVLQGSDRLCAAVLEAYRSAEASQLAEWADAVGDDTAQGQHQIAAPECATEAPPSAHLPADQLTQGLHRAAAELPAVMNSPQHLPPPAAHSHVRVHLDGSRIDRISLDLPAETTDDARLEQVLTEALREASTAARKAPAHRVQDHPDISAVLGLGKDSAAPGPAPHHREDRLQLLEAARQLLHHGAGSCRDLLRRARERPLPAWTDVGSIACTTTAFLDQLEEITATLFARAQDRLGALASPEQVGTLGAATLALALQLRSAEAIMATVIALPQGLTRTVGALEGYVDVLDAGADRAKLAG